MPNPAPLTGLSIGDALGMPFETQNPLSTHLMGWSGGYESSAFHKLKPGQFTDDTQMSLALAESLLERKFYDPATTARKYLGWYTSGNCRGIGTSTRQAMENLLQGREWHASGILSAEGNGSAMRATPIGVRHSQDTERYKNAAHWARIDAAITHQSEEAKEGSAAVAVAVAHLSSGGEKDDLLHVVLEHIQKCRLYYELASLKEARNKNVSFKTMILGKGWLLSGVTAHVVQTVPAAFTVFLYSVDFAGTVRDAIRLGGDTDTTAAIAGALAGSHYGYEAIPMDLKSGLEDAKRIREVELNLLR